MNECMGAPVFSVMVRLTGAEFLFQPMDAPQIVKRQYQDQGQKRSHENHGNRTKGNGIAEEINPAQVLAKQL